MRRAVIAVVFMLGMMAVGAAVILPPAKAETFEERRSSVLKELSSSIEGAVQEGKYHCCIDPPCTMCYMGNWLWDDGICRCDEMIAKGEFEKVCPQCKKGLEEGLCKSITGESAEVRD
ncbi:hypothetical protein KKH30_01855 [Candidatus Micrarchaeota archaeon]|nr:hypothetical protein [Candidatus Micrarchaeota archaeon]